MQKDIVIIGAGVVGCAIARELSAYEAQILVLEKGTDVASGASKANSGIVHAGYDAKVGSNKAKHNIIGSKMFEQLCQSVNAPYIKNEALVIAFDEEQHAVIENLYKQGIENGVEGLSIIDKNEVLKLEPNINTNVKSALRVKNSAITSPYELTCALADHAAVNGVNFLFNNEVLDIIINDGGFLILTNELQIQTKIIVNCAGVQSANIHNKISNVKYEIVPRKGEYYLTDHEEKHEFSRTIFQTPTKMGKGVLVTPTVHNNLLLGPTAQDIEDESDVSTTAEGLESVLEKAKLTRNKERLNNIITTFAGIRAHEKNGDFIIGATQGIKNSYETIGIESPGLSSAPSIAKEISKLIAQDNKLIHKNDWLKPPFREKPFNKMSDEEKQIAYSKNKDYGNIVCRCEQVTEAEIRMAINRPVGAKTVDAVKRRTRAGMGRCQGGFCSPRVLEILAQELQLGKNEIIKDGKDGYILTNKLGKGNK